MQTDRQKISQYLEEFDFKNLFTQVLGWDHHTQTLNITVDETDFLLTAVAEKHGMVVYECSQTEPDRRMPDRTTRRKIKKQVTKFTHENFIIYTNMENTTQIWLWVKREQGKPDAYFEHHYHKGQSGESLIQKLRTIIFSLEEEDQIDIVEVTKRVQAALYAERVTKKFYDRFKKEHDAFLKFLNGIPDAEMQKWYVSVMLNRLMFIYFIQKKSFLNNDMDYLSTKLTESQANGPNRYYKEFLCPLFFEGFAKPEDERSREMKRLLGKIPYLNGGIFQQHQLEIRHGEDINIPDKAFAQLFGFFEQYQWHLDDRPLKNDNEINPDVLGYIFEKYINQKQMGAYYTKEDITEYISKNTIIPFLFDKVKSKISSSDWKLLQDDPDGYIYDAVKKGVELDLPEEIAAGIDDIPKRNDCWNTLASEEYALPTEIWREVVARRSRYEHIQAILEHGEVHNINDLITYNLDICKFAKHVIKNCEGPELLRAFWKAITEVTILDPTCGSGAFLFAALNILEPLYDACLDRMHIFLEEVEDDSESRQSRKYNDFRNILADIKQHPNRRYFILKSIIINNLYGVDIMDEAIEICKLRLFLKMVAQIDEVRRIEPLPDIDFNIQAGNTLVGYATYDEVKAAVTGKLDFDDTMNRIEEKVEDIEWLFFLFRQQQTELGGTVTPTEKQVLQDKLTVLEDELNGYLAEGWGFDTPETVRDRNGEFNSIYQMWHSEFKPFHWFIAFYGILKNGGFDVIIGNPPYVESKDISGYETESCGNLYAYVFERSFQLLQKNGWKSMIIPHSAYCTDRMKPLQNLFHRSKRIGWIQTYSERPAKLFVGAEQSLAIYIIQQSPKPSNTLYTSRYHKWNGRFREDLFAVIEHVDVKQISFQNSIPKIHNEIEQSLWKKLTIFSSLGTSLTTRRDSYTIYFHNAARYWVRAMDFVPYFWNERDGEKISTQLKPLNFTSELDAGTVVAILNSSLFYWWYIVLSDCRHVNLREIRNFPIGIDNMAMSIKQNLSAIVTDLMADLKHHAHRKETYYKTTGRVVYDEFYPSHSKPIMDKVDRVLAKHYGFTDEELDFIINYDIKYRMGLGN